MFPGGNTSRGFFSYYSYILEQEEAKRIIVIKGGPGVGKSSFMKKIAEEMLDRGYDVEYMHCSSDNNSLDGLVIPSIKVALLDGTAPHVVDPQNPGVVDEIIHLGDYWNESGMRANRDAVLRENKEVGRFFARAYRYIKAAAEVYEDTAVINSWAMDDAKVNAVSEKLISDLFGNKGVSTKAGKVRRLFASAITPDGLKNYLGTLMKNEKVYSIKGQQGTGTEKLLEKVLNSALERGYYVEAYYCALHPEKLEHIIIPEISASLTTSNKYHAAEVNFYAEIDFNEYLDEAIIEPYEKEIEYNTKEFEFLLEKAIETIGKAKVLHDHMESYYIPNMDFEAVQRCCEATLARILNYAKE